MAGTSPGRETLVAAATSSVEKLTSPASNMVSADSVSICVCGGGGGGGVGASACVPVCVCG